MQSGNNQSHHSAETIMAALAELRRGVDVEIVKEKYGVADWTLAEIQIAHDRLDHENARVLQALKELLETLYAKVQNLNRTSFGLVQEPTSQDRPLGHDVAKASGRPASARNPATRLRRKRM